MGSTITSPTISITPETALIDEDVHITLSGFSPNLRLTIRVRANDDLTREWESRATFIADSNGNVDVALQRPTMGTYHDVDPMGLFWSMRPTLSVKKGEASFFVKTQVELPTIVTFDLLVDEEIVARTQVNRLYMSPGITVTQLTECGLVGKLYEPATSGPHPALLVLSGSDGSIRYCSVQRFHKSKPLLPAHQAFLFMVTSVTTGTRLDGLTRERRFLMQLRSQHLE